MQQEVYTTASILVTMNMTGRNTCRMPCANNKKGSEYVYRNLFLFFYCCCSTGAIITTAFLVLLMMALGTDWEHRRGVGREDKLHHGVGTTAAVPVSNVRVVEQV